MSIFFSLTPKRVTTTSLENRPKPAHPHRITVQDIWYLYKTCRLTNPQIHKWIREKWGGNPWRVQYSPGVCPEGTCPVVRSHPDSLCVGSQLHQERTYVLRDFWNLSRPFCHTAWKLTSQHTFQNSVLLDTWGLHLAFCLEASNDFDGVASTFCTE